MRSINCEDIPNVGGNALGVCHSGPAIDRPGNPSTGLRNGERGGGGVAGGEAGVQGGGEGGEPRGEGAVGERARRYP